MVALIEKFGVVALFGALAQLAALSLYLAVATLRLAPTLAA